MGCASSTSGTQPAKTDKKAGSQTVPEIRAPGTGGGLRLVTKEDMEISVMETEIDQEMLTELH